MNFGLLPSRRVVVVVLAGLLGTAACDRGPQEPAPPLTVAVMPFSTGTDGVGQPDFLANGLQADLIDLLSRVDGLTVLTQSSAANLAGDRAPGEGEAAAPFEGMLLEGRMERTPDRIHVEAWLRRTGEEERLWSETYDRGLTLDNVFQIQAEIAQQVAVALRVALRPDLVDEMGRRRTNSLEAYDLYLEGRGYYSRRFEVAEVLRAVDAFLRAQAVDSTFSAAHAAEAEARVWLYLSGGHPDQAESARAALDRAARLNPDAVETQLARANYLYRVERDFVGARRLLEGVLPRAPGHADLHSMLGGIARREGRWNDAVERFGRAAELDPARVGAAVTMAQTFRYLRRAAESLEWAERAVALDPSDTRARAERTWTLIGMYGDTAAAREALAPLSDDQRLRSRARVVLMSPPADPAFYRRDFAEALSVWESTTSALSQMMVSHVAGDSASAARFARLVAGDWDRAQRSGQEVPTFRASSMLYAAMAHVILGERTAGLSLADQAVALVPTRDDAFTGPRLGFMRALVAIAAGDTDDAFRRLNQLLDDPSELGPGQLRLNPWFDPLRDDSRFAALLGRAERLTTR